VEQPKSISIIIIDDDDTIRLGLKLVLQKTPGMSVVGEAEDGQSGLSKVLELAPDVVLMDIGMPDMDGVEATREIKSKLPNTKIMMLTSHENGEDIFAAFAAGADAYCIKDIPSKQLTYAIANIAEGIAWLDPRIAACVLKACRVDQPESVKRSRLQPLEFELLSLIVEGRNVEEILDQLKISRVTMMNLMPQITSKLAISLPGIHTERA